MATERYDALIEYLEREIKGLEGKYKEAKYGSPEIDHRVSNADENRIYWTLKSKKRDLAFSKHKKETE